MTINNVLELVRPNILGLEAYSTARDDCGTNSPEVFLDANENPFNNGVNRYPDPHQKELKARLAAIKGIPAESLFLGNGSDEAIDLVYRVFCEPGKSNAVSIAPSYGMYEVAAGMNDVEFRKVQLGEDFSLPVAEMLSAADERTRLMFICSPNNPTGNSFPKERIVELLRTFNGIVVLDEAYIDFSEQASLAPLVNEYPNLVVLQTLSKAWGMAGLRIGIAVADPTVIALMSKVKYPYNINVLAQRMALTKLDPAAKEVAVAEIIGQRFRLVKAFSACPQVRKVYPSDSNFLLVRFDNPGEVYARLLEAKVIVRDRSRVKGCEGCLRITVGTPVENDRLLRALGLGGQAAQTSAALTSAAQTSAGQTSAALTSVAKTSAGPSLADYAPVGTEILGERHVRIFRKTKETRVLVDLDLDGPSKSQISTGLKFFDHMLEQIPNHGGVALRVEAEGDLQVDEHHTVEDVGIVLGEAVGAALGSKVGIARYGFVLPMDDCDAAVLMDFGGRTDFRWKVSFSRDRVGDVPTEMFSHFFQSVCTAAKCNLHVWAEGENDHHKAEAVFKAFARALRMAVARTAFPYELPSSKGIL
jgi:histidinol-phosphate aminotransferase